MALPEGPGREPGSRAPRAVLFDAHRTLLHTEGEELLRDLAAEDAPPIAADDHDVHTALVVAEDLARPPEPPAASWAALLGLPPSAVPSCARALARGRRRNDLDPHARTVLAALRERGTRLGALSADPGQLGGLPPMDVVVATEARTDTASLLGEALEGLGVPAGSCWFVGTSMRAVLAAAAAGFQQAIVLERYDRRPKVPGLRAIRQLAELTLADPATDSTAVLVDVNEAARLATLAVDALSTLWDPEARGISAPMWRRTERLGTAVLTALEAAAVGVPVPQPVHTALESLRAAPLARANRRAVETAVRHLLMLHPQAAVSLRDLLDTFERRNRLVQWLGHEYDPGRPAAHVSSQDLVAACRFRRQPVRRSWQLTVVIDFRDVATDARLRNTIAAVAALSDQTLDRSAYHVVVVEEDSAPRGRDLLEPLVDTYIHIRHDGPYKRSWAHNVGAVAAGRAERYLCFLDSDVMLERSALSEVLDFLSVTGARALLPHSSLLYLDRQSSETAIRRRLLTPEAAVRGEECCGYRLMTNHGGCIFVESNLFYEVGGYDERYQGWGDEDNEFFALLSARTRVFQLAHDLVHLFHPRSRMETKEGTSSNDWVLHNPDGRPVDIGNPNRVPDSGGRPSKGAAD